MRRVLLLLALAALAVGAVGPAVAEPPMLWLEAQPQSLYVQPGADVIFIMNVSGLTTPVNGCQAMLGYSSVYFLDPVGGCVAPGGAIWDFLIWDSWSIDGDPTSGEIDTAIGVNAQGSVGTTENSRVAEITLTASTTEGATQLFFRADADPDPGLIESTFLSDLLGHPVWPAKTNSQVVVIDGTAPVMESITPSEGSCLHGGVTFVIDFSDANPLAYLELDIYGPPPYNTLEGRKQATLPADDATLQAMMPIASAQFGVTAMSYDAAEQKWTVTIDTDSALWPDGDWRWYVEVADAAGNMWGDMMSPPPDARFDWSIDNTAPVIQFATLSASCVKDQDVTVTASATDTGCAGGTITWEYKVGSGPEVDGLVVPNGELSEGPNDVFVRATDGNGNTSDWFSAGSVSKDTTAPQVASATLSDDCVKDEDVTITALATDTGCSGETITWEHSVNGGVAVAGLTVANAELSENANTITVRATDGNGNTSDWFAAGSVSKDTTAPSITDASLAASCVANSLTLNVTATDVGCAGGTLTYTYSIDGAGAEALANPIDITALADGDHAIVATVTDGNGNSASSAALPFTKDTAAPAISELRIEQGGISVVCPAIALQGKVDIYVTVTDPGCADLVIPPDVAVTGFTAVTYEGVDGDVYHYSVVVAPETANDSHTVNVTAQDSLGNSASLSSEFCVDKNQITGSIQLQAFTGASRTVVFVATGDAKKTWTQTLDFVNGVATYTLTGVPAGITGLSAKTNWSLRRKFTFTLNSHNQAIVDFVESNQLLGGDIDNSNSVNILDYGLLKAKWYTFDAACDITGDGQVNLTDYNTMKSNWFQLGHAE